MSPTLNWSSIKDIQFSIPDLSEQKQYADLLWKTEHLLELYKARLSIYSELVKSRFIEMFNDINQCTIGEISELINGDRGSNYPSSKDFNSSGVPFINAGHLKNGIISFESMNYISNDKYNSLRCGKVKRGDILYCLRGSLGKHGIVNIEKGIIASSLVIIRCNYSRIHPIYLSYCLDSKAVQEQLLKVKNGSSQPNLSASSVKNFTVPLPPIECQKLFIDFVQQVDKSKFALQNSIEDLQMLQKSISNKIFKLGE